MKVCKDCEYFKKCYDNYGICVRYPPHPFYGTVIVLANALCGEFKENKNIIKDINTRKQEG